MILLSMLLFIPNTMLLFVFQMILLTMLLFCNEYFVIICIVDDIANYVKLLFKGDIFQRRSK